MRFTKSGFPPEPFLTPVWYGFFPDYWHFLDKTGQHAYVLYYIVQSHRLGSGLPSAPKSGGVSTFLSRVASPSNWQNRIARLCLTVIEKLFIPRITVADKENGERQGDKKHCGSLFFGLRSNRLTKDATTAEL